MPKQGLITKYNLKIINFFFAQLKLEKNNKS